MWSIDGFIGTSHSSLELILMQGSPLKSKVSRGAPHRYMVGSCYAVNHWEGGKQEICDYWKLHPSQWRPINFLPRLLQQSVATCSTSSVLYHDSFVGYYEKKWKWQGARRDFQGFSLLTNIWKCTEPWQEERSSANASSILTNKSDQERASWVVLILPLAFPLAHSVTA